MKKPTDTFLAMIFINGGSSWGCDPDQGLAVERAKEICERDWGSLFYFDEGVRTEVFVYKLKLGTGWYASHEGVFYSDTKKRVPFITKTSVVLKNKKRNRRA